MSWWFVPLLTVMWICLLACYAVSIFGRSLQRRLLLRQVRLLGALPPLTGHGSGSLTGSLCLYRAYPVPTSCLPVGLHGSSVRP